MRQHNFRNTYFLKLISFYSFILILSFVAILIYSGQYLDQKAMNTSKSDGVRAVSTLQSYVREKNMTTKRIFVQLYNSMSYRNILETVQNPSDTEVSNIWTINEFMQLGLASDNDMENIALINLENSKMYTATKGTTILTDLKKSVQTRLSDYSQELKIYGTNIFPAYLDKSSPYGRYLMPIVCRVKGSDIVSDIGYLLTEFNCSNLDSQLKSFIEAYPFSDLFIMSGSGMVIYDSKREYINAPYPYFDTIKSAGSGRYTLGKPSYIEQLYDPDLDMYFASVTPLSELNKNIGAQKGTIYTVILICSILALASTYFFTMLYSKRVTVLYNTIGVIRSGDLSVRVPKSRSRDEISQISESFNEMCDRLEDYIQRVYVSDIQAKESAIHRKDAELKQKTAELYALQTQINPHFLYNALESIRMRALSKGNKDVAKMAYILSTLFRQSLKQDLIVSIAAEIDNCKLYLDLTRLRYSDRMAISFDVDDETVGYGIIRHVLQPIIENSVNHGIDMNKPVSEISVNVRHCDEKLIIQVKDNGVGIESDRLRQLQANLDSANGPDSEKIGIFNVNQRIRMMFGNGYGLEIDSEPLVGTTTTIKIPALGIEEMKNYVQRFDS